MLTCTALDPQEEGKRVNRREIFILGTIETGNVNGSAVEKKLRKVYLPIEWTEEDNIFLRFPIMPMQKYLQGKNDKKESNTHDIS